MVWGSGCGGSGCVGSRGPGGTLIRMTLLFDPLVERASLLSERRLLVSVFVGGELEALVILVCALHHARELLDRREHLGVPLLRGALELHDGAAGVADDGGVGLEGEEADNLLQDLLRLSVLVPRSIARHGNER